MMNFLCRTTLFLCVLLLISFSWPVHALEKGPVGTIRVGIFPFEPFNFTDENGVAQGLNPDLLREIVRDERWKIEFVKGSWAECLDLLQRQEIDLLVSVAYSSERAQVMDFSYESVVELWGQVFVRPEGKSFNINDLDGRKVAVMRRDISGTNFIKTAEKFGIRCEIQELATHAEVFAAVQKQEADAGVAPQHYGLRHAKEHNLVGSTIIFSPFSIYFASKKGTQHELLSHIDAHLSKWKRDKGSFYYQSLEHWMGNLAIRHTPVWLTYSLIAAISSALLFSGFTLLLKIKVKRRTKELQESESRYRELVENANSIILRIDSRGCITYFNEFAQSFFGYEAQEVIGKSVIGTLMPETDSTGVDLRDMIIDIGSRPQLYMSNENENMLRDGTRVWIAWANKPLYDADGELEEILCVGHDVTERRKAEKQLVESHELLNNLAEMVPGVIYQYRLFPDGRSAFPYASPGMNDIYEIEPKDVREDATPVFSRLHPDDHDRVAETIFESARTLETFYCEFRVILPKQGLRWRWSQAQPQRMADGGTLWHGIISDITKSKLAEEALRASEEDLKESQRIAHVGTWRLDLASNQVVWSDELYRMYGLDPQLPPPPYTEHSKLFTPESWERLSTALNTTISTGIPYDLELETVRIDGSQGWMWVHGMTLHDARGVTVGLRGVAQDITELKRAEEEKKKLALQLQQAQKMEAIGTLAGGIAHDFNNVLAAILGYAELVRGDMPKDSLSIDDIDQVILAGYRARDLVKQILAFSRQANSDPLPLQPAVIINETLKLLRASLPATITINQDIDPQAGVILADPTHIHQILMNLCTNAFHAMEMEGGTLTIVLRKEIIGKDITNNEPYMKPGRYIRLSIKDTGAGISPEIREKIFDPYFTTKEVGKGTGMGLAVVHGIVQSYGGSITCDSRPGEGTAFHITFPTTEVETKEKSESADKVLHGEEHILLIDDEEILLEMSRKMFERMGYRVTSKTNSLEALSTFLNQPDTFDLVITDQTMPIMTGMDLARRMLQVRPELPIILCTGYSSLISEEKAKSIGIKGFAFKPISKKDIGNLVEKVLINSSNPQMRYNTDF